MGWELVKKAFSKGRSSGDGRCPNGKNTPPEKGTGKLRKLKFCGDDLGSVLEEEEDMSIVRSSEAANTQMEEEILDETTLIVAESFQNKETHPSGVSDEKKQHFSEAAKPLLEDDAAIVIQRAFRGFLVRRKSKQSGYTEEAETTSIGSLCTSTKVRAGDSVKHHKFQADISRKPNLYQKQRLQISHQKEWDDSTVTGNISKQRMQNRLEAMSRRERALAYAFSQKLRTCSTRKRLNTYESHEPNMGWSWLERWMATRIPDNSSAMQDCAGMKIGLSDRHRRSTISKKQFDLAIEERESCGSNEVPVSENFAVLPAAQGDVNKSASTYLKAQKASSRKSNLPRYQYMARPNKVGKIVSIKEAEKEKKCKQKQALRTGEVGRIN